MSYLLVSSPAKINLFLNILGMREDGYHDIQTLFQFVDWCDQLTFSTRDDNKINLITDLINVPHQENLIVRAAHVLKQASGCDYGVDITLDKHIPMGAGLGGGSSNAATTLLALNKLWGLNLSQAQLLPMAKQLGADVAVFILGKSAYAEGIGDILTPMILPEQPCVLIIPKCHVSTPLLYNHPDLPRDTAPIDIQSFKVGEGQNDFLEVACQQYPQIQEAVSWLNRYSRAHLSGSGCCVFATFDTEAQAGKIAKLAAHKFEVMVCKTMNYSSAYLSLK